MAKNIISLTTEEIPQEVSAQPGENDGKPISYWNLFLTFLKAGCLGFGGFMSLISVVESILVEKRKLMKPEDMLDGITLANLLPGPQAVNVVAYAGNKLRGTRGAIISAVAVILPSFLLMVLLSYLYSLGADIKQIQKYFHGFVPAVCAVILAVAWRMAKQTIKGWKEIVLISISTLALFISSTGWFGIPKSFQLYTTFAIVIIFGIIGYFIFKEKRAANYTRPSMANFPFLKVGLAIFFAVGLMIFGLAELPLHPDSNLNMMRTFSGLSVMLFGGGYVIIPMMQQIVVDGYHWLLKDEFVDCIAFSQIMPGPILIASAFIGFRVNGILGAVLLTIAIFTPPAILMVIASQALDYLKKSVSAKAIMRGIRCGVIGMVLIAVYIIGVTPPSRGIDWTSIREVVPTLIIFGGALIALIKYNVDVVYIIPAAGLIGYFLYK